MKARSATSGLGLRIVAALKKRSDSCFILYGCSPTVLTGTAADCLVSAIGRGSSVA